MPSKSQLTNISGHPPPYNSTKLWLGTARRQLLGSSAAIPEFTDKGRMQKYRYSL